MSLFLSVVLQCFGRLSPLSNYCDFLINPGCFPSGSLLERSTNLNFSEEDNELIIEKVLRQS